eukprot:Sspe_Gene.95471::Locus_67749_Transcript_1_1_Confidence_1.000_Length_2428::g.95471::m.95471
MGGGSEGRSRPLRHPMEVDPARLPRLLQAMAGEYHPPTCSEPHKRMSGTKTDIIPRPGPTVHGGHRVNITSSRKPEEIVASSMKLLAQAKDEFTGRHTKTAKGDTLWGRGQFASLEDAPLTSGTSSSHKPPLLATLESHIAQSLSALHTRYKGSSFLLPLRHLPVQGEAKLPDTTELLGEKPGPVTTGIANHLLDWSEREWSAGTPSQAGTPQQSHREVRITIPPVVQSSPTPLPGSTSGFEGIEALHPYRSETVYRRERLAVFRECARMLTAGFRTYRPLLLWITDEYQHTIGYLEGLIERLGRVIEDRDDMIERLEATLEEKEKIMIVEREQAKRDIAALTRKAEKLGSELSRWDTSQSSSMAKIRQLQNMVDELDEAKENLQKQVSLLHKQLHEERTSDVERNLRVKAQSEVERLTKQLHEVRRLHEVVLRENRGLKDTVDELHKKIPKDGNRKDEALTPRPRWHFPPISKALQYHQNSTAASVEVAAEQIMEMQDLLSKLQLGAPGGGTGINIQNRKWLIGLGTGEDVTPFFLRFKGRLPNLRLPKREAEGAIHAFFREKAKSPDRAAMPPDRFFPIFLTERYGRERCTEMAYNIWFALQRFRSDPDCGLFIRILLGEVDESVWSQQLRLIFQIKDALILADEGGTRKASHEDIMAAVTSIFPNKTDEALDQISQALIDDMPMDDEGLVPYMKLFDEDTDCNQSHFVETIRSQHIMEREQFLLEIEEAIIEYDDFKDGIITPPEMAKAIWSVDPGHPGDVMDGVLAKCFGCRLEDLGIDVDTST